MASIGIIGSGAVGLFVGSKLLDVHHQVHFLARNNFAELCHNGFHVDKTGSITCSYPGIHVYDELSKMPKQDYVILCTTIADNASYLGQLRRILNHNTLVISVQNGINFEERIYAAVNPNLVLSGTCWIKVSKLNPTHIRHDFGLKILLGEYPTHTVHPFKPEIDEFRSLMVAAGFEFELLDNYLSAQFTKLAINLPFFGLMLRYQIKQGKVALLHHPELLELQSEISVIAKQLDIPIDDAYIGSINEQLKKLPEADLSVEEKIRLAKEMEPNFLSFFCFLGLRNVKSPKLHALYNLIVA